MIESLKKEIVELDNKLVRLSNFLYYKQRKLIALNLKWKFKFSTGNQNLDRGNKILRLKEYKICRVFKRVSEKKIIYIQLFY